jgi:hypothetical protein
MRLERTLPRQELLLRKLVAPQNLLHRDPAATHGSHYRSLATGCPSDGIGGWQIVHWGCPQRGLLDDVIQRILEDLRRVQ